MGNDFSKDYSVHGLYRFESGALLIDSSGRGNHLTDISTVPPIAESAGDFREGACCADFEFTTSQNRASRDDGDLSAGFPLKNGDTNALVSWALWFKQESSPGAGQQRYIISKYGIGNYKRSLAFGTSGSAPADLHISWGYGIASALTWNPYLNLTSGQWYHIGIAADGINQTCLVRFYDLNADTAYTYYKDNWGQTMNIGDGAFVIGGLDLTSSNSWDGLIDEAVVFNRLLTVDLFDYIRLGTYAEEYGEPLGPTMDQLMRHGTWFSDGIKQSMFWAD